LVNVLKTTCGLAVVDDFKQLLKYNIRLLAEPAEPEEGAKADDSKEPDGKSEKQPTNQAATKEPEQAEDAEAAAAATEDATGKE
jgi:hypothetical protein